jgi:DNA repair photolyase
VLTLFDPWKGAFCTCPAKYQLSPYTGCSHTCLYCYTTAYIPRPFSPRPKKDFLKRLEKDLPKMDKSKHISMSNSSDPYTSPEETMGITRNTLRLLLDNKVRIQLITKSSLVTRDIDLIRNGNCSVSVSITTLSKEKASRLEPGAPSPQERMDALSLLSDSGIPTTARIDPIIPGINDDDLENLVETVCETGIGHLVASTCKIRADGFNRLIKAFPEERDSLWRLYWAEGERFGNSQYLRRSLRAKILRDVEHVVKAAGISFGVCREGLSELSMCQTCDGSHMIPTRETPSRE